VKVDSLAQRTAACRYSSCVELLFALGDRRQMSLKAWEWNVESVVYENDVFDSAQFGELLFFVLEQLM
jgi:hypothetical protein